MPDLPPWPFNVSDRVLFGEIPMTIEALGTHRGERWAMAMDEHGVITLGEPGDFTVIGPDSTGRH